MTCPCSDPQDPQVVSNPPGLPQISDRVDDFTGFRRALLRPLPGEQVIGAWHPAPGDLGLQVLEWWAYLADILTFYNERIANESYLGTATMPASLANLVALIGYQPAPGIAATGNVAVTRTTAHPNEPLVIPAGMRISSTPTPGIPAQTFEVSGTAPLSFPGVSSVPVIVPPSPDLDDSSVLLAGKVSGIKAGDQLLLAESGFAGADDNWALVTVASVTPQTDPNTGASNTQVTFPSEDWGPVKVKVVASEPLEDHEVIGHSFEIEHTSPYTWHVGEEPVAPPASARQWADYRLMRPVATAALWNHGSPPSGQQIVSTTSDGNLAVHLSATVRGISPGDLVLFDGGSTAGSALAAVVSVAEQFWTVPYPETSTTSTATEGGNTTTITTNLPDIALAHTVLTVALAAADASELQGLTPGTVTVRYGYKDVGRLIGVPVPELDSLPVTVLTPAWYTPPTAPAVALLQDSTGAGVLVTYEAAGSGQVSLTGDSPASPLIPPLQLLLDVVPVTRGTTVSSEVLGSGNAALISQSFTLAKSPLTYLASGAGSVAALAVYVDQVQWQEAGTFYNQPSGARIYVVSRSPDQSVTTITFGDGVNGARLTTGTGNVTATYRYGSGLASPPAGRLTNISQPQPSLASVQNPVPVSGGNDPQAPADVRADAPASVFTFGRAISAVDYEVVAAEAAGVTRAAADWTFDGAQQRTLVTVYVSGDSGAVGSATNALAGSDDPNRPVAVVGATPLELTLSATLVIATAYQSDPVLAAATAGLGALFSPAGLGIGARLYVSAIEAALSVPGVVAVHNLMVSGPQIGDGDVFDPGTGCFFDLQAGNLSLGWVNP